MQVHLGDHWTCAVVDLQHKAILYFDSLQVLMQLGLTLM